MTGEDLPGTAGAQPPSIETILVPVDETGASLSAVDHAAAIAQRYAADVHALYVYGPEQSREIGTPEADHEAIADQAQSTLDSVREACEDLSIAVTCSTAVGFSAARLTQHPGSVILDCANDVDADFLVIPREQSADAPGQLAKAAEYVLAYASEPVLSV